MEPQYSGNSPYLPIDAKNRLRVPIRGRVLCFTNSALVEFTTDAMRYSYPLCYNDFGSRDFSKGVGICFMAELNGFLLLDAGSYYKIEELGPYTRAEFDFTKVRVLPCTDFRTPDEVPTGGTKDTKSPISEAAETAPAERARDEFGRFI